ncbi:hypothetical protein BKFM_00666 [Borrelia sp. HM]|nr:hypothetical protein BKFM_00666 [Borrelia sp. HM]
MLNIYLKNSYSYYNFISRTVTKYMLGILVAILFSSFLFSSCMIIFNYENIFFRKVFYFHLEHKLIADLRFLKEKKTIKENLDLVVRDFLLGNINGFALQFGTRDVKLLYSFINNDVYCINLSKEFYYSFENGGYNDSDKLRVNLFVKSLEETINFNYPGYVGKILIFIEGYILNV